MIRHEHLQVLQTLQRAGLISRQAMQTIRGQVLGLPPAQAESFLKKLIKQKGTKT